MRHKGKGPPSKMDRVLFIRTTKEIDQRLEVVRAARSESAGVKLSRADVVRALISEECKRVQP